MKKIHLLCNAHLDPVWLWRWNEGVAEAISTFRVAADFCEEYDGFVFNHNEAVLYEWVEEHEPALFERIKKLVAAGKWKIFGGWYLQPDCVMTSGESLLSQIKLGNDYFMEKFGIKPTTAMNIDPFGHSRGLVQILKMCGYDSYIFMRPQEKFRDNFLWEGFDGSRILAHGIGRQGGYNSGKGKAANKIRGFIQRENGNIDGEALVLWGIGNHGGGPSRIDLENINKLMAESDIEIIHSNAEDYIKGVKTEGLPVVSKSIGPCFPGCNTSMIRIKQANRRVENAIALTEKAMCYADMSAKGGYNSEKLLEAKKALAFCQFHDILPGSAIKKAEDDSLRDLSYAEEILDRLYTKAFFKLCEGQKKAKDGEIPILIFNPHPYEIEGEFECGFMLGDQNWNEGEVTLGTVYDEYGNALPTQNENPDATFALDWVKKVSFRGKLKASSVTRFDCRLRVEQEKDISYDVAGDFITVCGKDMVASISKKTGLIEKYEVNGKNYITSGGKLEVMSDNEDPWGMKMVKVSDKIGEFSLMTDEKANTYAGYPEEKLSNVRIIEDGEVRTKVQAFFEYSRSTAVVEYTIPKNDSYIDITVKLVSNDVNRFIKYSFDSGISGTPYGETAFGCEQLYGEEIENVFHKWCGIKNDSDTLYIINAGTYAGSFTENQIKLSLLRTPVYSAHPIGEKPIAPHDRSHDHIDIGERNFSFRITTEKNIAREAQIFAEAPRALSFFPSGDGEKKSEAVRIDNDKIIMSSFSKNGDKYVLTLQNFSDEETDAEVVVVENGERIKLHFRGFELKQAEVQA